MFSKIIGLRRGEDCRVHKAPARAANRTLLVMMLASLLLIVWHVLAHGPAEMAASQELADKSFLHLLAAEIWDLLFDRHGIVAELWDVFPYFIAGILLAGYIRTYKIALKMQSRLRRYGILSVFLASVVGILTPLCACGTLTTAISLLFAGIPLAPVVSLLVTSPLMSPSTYLLTLNDLGPEWTVIRTLAAFFMGIFAGVITHLLRDRGFRTENIFIEGAVTRGDFHDESYPDERLKCNCREKFGNRVAARTSNMFVVFLAKSAEMLWLVGKYVIVGVAVGAVVERYMPYDWLYRLFGRKDALNIVWITLGSVPVFLHQISASSILFHIKNSLDGTLDGGAGLAFLIGGPVTAMPAMIMFWTIFKKRVFALYMFVCIAGTILVSYAFQSLYFVPHADMGHPLLQNVSSLSGGAAPVIEKRDKNVRIVMDPGGEAIIATYSDVIRGGGGIVFDSGSSRFLRASGEGVDNRQYVLNAADWLEELNAGTEKKSILVYGLSDGGRRIFGHDNAAALKGEGYSIAVTDRIETPEISQGGLAGYSQVWLFIGGEGTRPLSSEELDAISGFHREGKGILVVAGSDGDADSLAVVNQVSSRYGVRFSGRAVHAEALPANPGSFFFTRASVLLGNILKYFHKA